jgi:hypothetical protein
VSIDVVRQLDQEFGGECKSGWPLAGSSAAGAGTTTRVTAGPQTGTSSCRDFGSTTWASAWPEVWTEPETDPSNARRAGGEAEPTPSSLLSNWAAATCSSIGCYWSGLRGAMLSRE